MLWHVIKYNRQHCVGVAYWRFSAANKTHVGEKERTLNGCKSVFNFQVHTLQQQSTLECGQ